MKLKIQVWRLASFATGYHFNLILSFFLIVKTLDLNIGFQSEGCLVDGGISIPFMSTLITSPIFTWMLSSVYFIVSFSHFLLLLL